MKQTFPTKFGRVNDKKTSNAKVFRFILDKRGRE